MEFTGFAATSLLRQEWHSNITTTHHALLHLDILQAQQPTHLCNRGHRMSATARNSGAAEDRYRKALAKKPERCNPSEPSTLLRLARR